jgi:O-methyltransferase
MLSIYTLIAPIIPAVRSRGFADWRTPLQMSSKQIAVDWDNHGGAAPGVTSEVSQGLVNPAASRQLYIEMIKKSLMDSIYDHVGFLPVVPSTWRWRRLVAFLARRGIELVRRVPVDKQKRLEGRDWPLVAHTMIGKARLDNIQSCVESVIHEGVPGDLIETGVWRGGATILMRAILKVYGVTDRKVWVADSFCGLPSPDSEKYPADADSVFHTYRELVVPLEEVFENFAKYDLLDDQVCFLKGWFHETLPAAPIERLAVIRLDGDMYESTMDALTSLYPKLSAGGYLIVDDYGCVAACKQAVDDFRNQQGIRDEILAIDADGVYWRRSTEGSRA